MLRWRPRASCPATPPSAWPSSPSTPSTTARESSTTTRRRPSGESLGILLKLFHILLSIPRVFFRNEKFLQFLWNFYPSKFCWISFLPRSCFNLVKVAFYVRSLALTPPPPTGAVQTLPSPPSPPLSDLRSGGSPLLPLPGARCLLLLSLILLLLLLLILPLLLLLLLLLMCQSRPFFDGHARFNGQLGKIAPFL